MSGAMSRNKGARAERAVVNWLNTNGFAHAERRGAGFEASDIIGTPGVTWEIKNQKTMDLAGWVDQLVAEIDADNNLVGAVVHKRRGQTDVGDWYATMPVRILCGLLIEAGYGEAEDLTHICLERAPSLQPMGDFEGRPPSPCVRHLYHPMPHRASDGMTWEPA